MPFPGVLRGLPGLVPGGWLLSTRMGVQGRFWPPVFWNVIVYVQCIHVTPGVLSSCQPSVLQSCTSVFLSPLKRIRGAQRRLFKHPNHLKHPKHLHIYTSTHLNIGDFRTIYVGFLALRAVRDPGSEIAAHGLNACYTRISHSPHTVRTPNHTVRTK